MSINFDDDMGPEATDMIRKLYPVTAMDERTALLDKIDLPFLQKDMKNIANAAKQVVTLEVNAIGDRKEVGGRVYELTVVGWKILPIGETVGG